VSDIDNSLGKVTDKYALKAFFAAAGVNGGVGYGLGVTGTPITIDASNIDEYFASAARALDEADAPEAGRFAVITPKMRQALTLNNIYVAATTDEAARKGGFAGMYMGFEVYVSNNLPAGVADGLGATEAGVIFGIKEACAVGYNFDQMRTVECEDRFGEKLQAVAKFGAGNSTPAYVVKGVVVK
jgi:hypothetical protein